MAEETQTQTTDQTQQTQETAEQKVARLERELGDEKKAREAETLKAKEHEDSAKFWHDRARNGAQPATTNRRDGAEMPPPDAEEDNVDLLDVAAKGPKAMKAWLQKQGFVSREEAEQLTNAKASSMVRQAEVVRQYPELNDRTSEFFKETTAEFARLKGRGVPEIEAMELAAEMVGIRRSAKAEPEDKNKDKGGNKGRGTEEERRQRAKAQDGDGRRSTQRAEEDKDLDDTQKHIIEAFGITEDAYKKRADAGVQYAGRR